MIIKTLKMSARKRKLMKRSLTIYQVNLWDCSVKKTISQSCAALISAYDDVTGVALLPL